MIILGIKVLGNFHDFSDHTNCKQHAKINIPLTEYQDV